MKNICLVEFFKVKGHADHPQNNRCDELARAAIDEYRRINSEQNTNTTQEETAAQHAPQAGAADGSV